MDLDLPPVSKKTDAENGLVFEVIKSSSEHKTPRFSPGQDSWAEKKVTDICAVSSEKLWLKHILSCLGVILILVALSDIIESGQVFQNLIHFIVYISC